MTSLDGNWLWTGDRLVKNQTFILFEALARHHRVIRLRSSC